MMDDRDPPRRYIRDIDTEAAVSAERARCAGAIREWLKADRVWMLRTRPTEVLGELIATIERGV